jgi:hypothetical protein
MGSRKLTFLKKAKFLARFIPDIPVYSGYSGFGSYVYSGIFRAGIFTSLCMSPLCCTVAVNVLAWHNFSPQAIPPPPPPYQGGKNSVRKN